MSDLLQWQYKLLGMGAGGSETCIASMDGLQIVFIAASIGCAFLNLAWWRCVIHSDYNRVLIFLALNRTVSNILCSIVKVMTIGGP